MYKFNPLAVAVIFLAMVVSSCTGEDIPVTSVDRAPMAFSCVVPSTKGTLPLTDVNLTSIGVYAGYEEDGVSFGASSPVADYIDNVRYTRGYSSSVFAESGVCYWPFSGCLSFFAYAPYIGDGNLLLSDAYVSGYPVFTFCSPSNPSRQEDFCLAESVLDVVPTADPIQLSFHHTLCQVMFSANFTGTKPLQSPSLHVLVDTLELCGVIGRKDVNLLSGDPWFSWEDDAGVDPSCVTSYVLDRLSLKQLVDNDVPAVTVPATDNHADLTTSAGLLYMIPQTAGSASLRIVLGYYEGTSGNRILRARAVVTSVLPSVTWVGGHCYRYRLTVDLAAYSVLSSSVSVTPWVDVDNNAGSPVEID